MGDEWNRAPLMRRASQVVWLAALRAVWRFEAEGVDNLPETGPLILAGGCHTAMIDGPLLAIAAAPRRCMIGLTKQEVFKVPLVGWYLSRVGSIPVDRRGDVQSLRAALDVLERGGCLGMFPEGTRSKTGEPGRPKPGVGFLAARTRACVVPARIVGASRFPWSRLRVKFGSPVPPPPPEADRAACQAFSEVVLGRVFRL